MASYWVISADGQSYGPADEAALAGWAREGRINAQSILQDAGTNQRLYASQVPAIAMYFAPAAPAQAPAYQQPIGYQQQQTAVPMAGYGAYQQPAYQQPAYQQPQAYQQPTAQVNVVNYTTAAPAANMMMYQAGMKSTGTAYILWFFFGSLGAHRFYTGNTGSGVAMLLLFLLSFPLMFVLIGFFTLSAVGIWALVDLFLIPGLVQNYNMMLASRMR